MRLFRTSSAIRRTGSIAAGLVLLIVAPAFGQSVSGADDSTNNRIASAAKASMVRTIAIARSAQDSIQLASGDKLFVGESLLTPYQSTASGQMPNGFTWKLPGTNLALSNGSAWFRRSGEGQRRNGIRISLQLTY